MDCAERSRKRQYTTANHLDKSKGEAIFLRGQLGKSKEKMKFLNGQLG